MDIEKFTGKSINSIINNITLLRLHVTIHQGLKTGIVSPTIGYVFAANLDCARLMDVYRNFLRSPKTAEDLKRRFKQYQDEAEVEQNGQAAAKKPFQRFYDDMKSARAAIEKKEDAYAKADIEQLLQEVERLGALLKERLQSLFEGAAKTGMATRPQKKAKAFKRLKEAAAGVSSKGSKKKKSGTPSRPQVGQKEEARCRIGPMTEAVSLEKITSGGFADRLKSLRDPKRTHLSKGFHVNFKSSI